MPPLKNAWTRGLTSFLLVVALLSLGVRAAPAHGALSGEKRIAFEGHAPPAAFLVSGDEVKSFARKTSAPSAPNLFIPGGWISPIALPAGSFAPGEVEVRWPSSMKFGRFRSRAPPASLG